MDIKIRKFKKQDQEQVYTLITSVLKKEFDLDKETYPEFDLGDISDSYGGKKDIFLVAVLGNSVIGTIAVKEDDKNTALLRRISVSPEFRGIGLGKQLIIKAIEFCQQEQYRLVHFRSTEKMEAANSLCQKNGFKVRASMDLGDTTILKLTRRLRTGQQRRTSAGK
ncbi:MAG: GNAT family N-acetyltransferase [PVC group bacterium]|nr:GNAT family N-acetyltransferase [PVC group bacterium]